jgi:hypothetical protein
VTIFEDDLLFCSLLVADPTTVSEYGRQKDSLNKVGISLASTPSSSRSARV